LLGANGPANIAELGSFLSHEEKGCQLTLFMFGCIVECIPFFLIAILVEVGLVFGPSPAFLSWGHAELQLLCCFIFIIIVFCVFLDFVLKGLLPQLLQVVFLHVPFWTASFFKGFPLQRLASPLQRCSSLWQGFDSPSQRFVSPLQRLISLPFS
jgi:hypothetical protein